MIGPFESQVETLLVEVKGRVRLGSKWNTITGSFSAYIAVSRLWRDSDAVMTDKERMHVATFIRDVSEDDVNQFMRRYYMQDVAWMTKDEWDTHFRNHR